LPIVGIHIVDPVKMVVVSDGQYSHTPGLIPLVDIGHKGHPRVGPTAIDPLTAPLPRGHNLQVLSKSKYSPFDTLHPLTHTFKSLFNILPLSHMGSQFSAPKEYVVKDFNVQELHQF
jgi:hypothetical protein